MRIGFGLDRHRLVPGRPCILGGVRFTDWLYWLQVNAVGLVLGEVKRWVALMLSTLVATGAYLALGLLAQVPLPVDVTGWINLIIYLGSLAFTGSQILHGRCDLGRNSPLKL